MVFNSHKRLVEQLLEQLQHPIYLDIVAAQDVLGCRQRPTPAKDGEPPHQLSLRLRQELVAPVERRAQRLVAAGCGSAAADQQSETIPQAGRELLNTQQFQPSGSQLDRKRDAVQLATDVGD